MALASRGQRIRFVDVHRGLAVLVMIEAHVVNGLLLAASRETWWFKGLDFLNGLVAPSFLLISGFAFALASDRKLDDFLHFRSSLFRTVQRIALIWILGYALHVSYFSYRKLMSYSTAQDWTTLFQSDILHCIGFGLFVLILLVLIFRKRAYFEPSLEILAVSFIAATPIIWNSSFPQQLPVFLREYFTIKEASVFPVFPWAAFLFIGGTIGFRYIDARRSESEQAFMLKLLKVACGLIVLGIISRLSGFDEAILGTWMKGSPGFLFPRIGLVMLVAAVLWYFIERNAAAKRPSRLVHSLEMAGQESLFIYVAHLVVIYGSAPTRFGISQIYSFRLTIAQCLAGSAALIAAMWGSAWIWHTLKRSYRIFFRMMQFSLVFLVLYFFFTRPW